MSKCLQCDKHRETRGGVCEDCREANASRAFSALSSRPRADPKDATIRDLEAALAEAREANGIMAEALEPFAKWIKAARGMPWRPGPILTARDGTTITVGHFDSAAEALAHRLATKEQNNRG